MHAAVDANCLAAQSGQVYWTYVDYLHTHGQEISGADRNQAKSFDALDRIARKQGTLGKLDSGSSTPASPVRTNPMYAPAEEEAESLRDERTPVLFIDGERIVGVVPEEQVWLAIDRALRAAGVEPPTADAGNHRIRYERNAAWFSILFQQF